MQKNQKIAIARIFSDLIQADRIIDSGEMEYWNRICLKYSIDRDIEMAAKNISFADAITIICSSEIVGLREELLTECQTMTMSDGFCAHSEAKIVMALVLMFELEQTFRVECISIPKADFNVDVSTVIYVESNFDTATNDAITKGYRTIFKELQLAGFHFIYLPYIIAHYRNTEPILFHQVLSFLAPSLSGEGINHIYQSLLKMTTGEFCNDILCNKCGITNLRGTYPALLIKIGNSFVGQMEYANYLKLEVDEDIVKVVQMFVDRFCGMLNSDIYVVSSSEEKESQFHFHGFYKQLLDIFIARKDIRSSVVIDPYKEEIRFPELDMKVNGLHRREKALYTLMLCLGSEGISFNQPNASDGLIRYKQKMQRVQDRYCMIYCMFGGDRDSAPNLSQPEIRRPIFSCLKRSLKNLPALYNALDYNITKNGDGVFSVNIDRNLVLAKELDGDELVPLKDSTLYKRFVCIG